MDEKIHVGELIRNQIEKEGRSVSWLSGKMSCDRTNIYKIYQRTSIDLVQLYRLCICLDYDFFAHYSEMFRKNRNERDS
jgi:hypothetical protein